MTLDHAIYASLAHAMSGSTPKSKLSFPCCVRIEFDVLGKLRSIRATE